MNNGATRAKGGINGTGRSKPVVITGGAGFVGTNLADRLLSDGERVILFDNLSRAGVERNYEWLERKHRGHVRLEVADTRDVTAIRRVLSDAGAVFHLAAQVAVTTSLVEPRFDFEVNAIGTLNILEALRSLKNSPPLIFTSTNKVYGSLSDVPLTEQDEQYEPIDEELKDKGISESQQLNFYSPYGCSKGTADQYVLDYARLFGLPAVVLRMSCVYGPHQCGTEDQGWVAHFLLQAIARRPITLFGDGKQVRDILFVEDLVEALLLARERSHDLAGEAFNLGGGPRNITSLLELLALIADLESVEPRVERQGWRPGDQRYYATNFSKFQAATGWVPKVSVANGVRRLHAWLQRARATEALAAVQLTSSPSTNRLR
jgi:CDP-paratose 2-epimerase